MSKVMSDFLAEAQAALDSFPYEDFSEAKDNNQKSAMVAALYFRWLLEKGLCHADIHAKRGRYGNPSTLSLFYGLIGGILQQSIMTNEANNFTKNYYRPGWSHFYYADLESLFPDVADFADIKDTSDNLIKLFELLDKRLFEWKKEYYG